MNLKKIKKIVVNGLIAAIIFIPTLGNAATIEQNVHLLSGQLPSTSSAMSRTMKYSYVKVRCDSVYPPRGSGIVDTYTKMQCSVRSGYTLKGIGKLNAEVLSENDSNFSDLYISEGYLNVDSVVLYFMGNDPDREAYANVAYDPM